MAVIPFYGTGDPEMFAIERRAMDRPGLVIGALARRLPASGRVLDIGAGDGHTAMGLMTANLHIVALEPARPMMRLDRPLAWVQGDAEHLPFSPASFDAAYATWAYFFSRNWDPSPGIGELHRVVRPGGPLLIVDNLGGDEFTALASSDITADAGSWQAQGFECEEIETRFEFESLQEARKLLGFYFGDRGRAGAKKALSYRVGVFHGASRGGL